MEGNLRLKIDCVSLIVGSKCTVFALFYLVFEGNFPITSPGWGLFLEGRFNGEFLLYRFGGLIFGGAYTWKGLFSEFYGMYKLSLDHFQGVDSPKRLFSHPLLFVNC